MQIQFETFTVNKRFPLTISYGTTSQSTNVWVKIIQDGIEGWGEATPFRAGGNPQTTEMIQNALLQIIPMLEIFSPYQRQEIEQILLQNHVPSAVQAAIDIALYDWLGKSVNLPIWKMWGLNRNIIASTSVTIGINTPEAAKIRVKKWLEFADIRVLKVKLGSPEGIIADQQMFLAVREQAPTQEIFIDANGGWNLADAVVMGKWLAQQGVKYLEQPLAKGNEIELIQLKQQQPLPIFVDESCFISRDIPQLAQSIDGINIKLMKSGGLTEAIRMISTARALNLQVMFGCYSDSTLANTAAAQLSPLADYIDLDSHLNLLDDPFCGAILHEGRIFPNDLPGLGVKYHAFGT